MALSRCGLFPSIPNCQVHFDASSASVLPACLPETFAGALPSNAHIISTTRLERNSTFDVPLHNIPYPHSPRDLPALCSVQVEVISSESSSYQFGLFLPDEWNYRFLAVGNGGFGGGINWLDMGAGVAYGFASMSTDTGHSSGMGSIEWARDQPEKKIDWGYRAMHGSVVAAKQLIESYYVADIHYNYYSGCSTGGRQGLREVQLYPDDFDGVLAGAPAWWTSHLQTWTVKLGLYNLPVDGPGHIPRSQFPLIEKEILRQCDPQDGVRDSIISNPRGCKINLNALLCSGPSVEASSCLTAAQVETLSDIYTDYIETNQTLVFPRVEPGSEAQWPFLVGGDEPNSIGTEYVKYFLLSDPDWDSKDFDFSIVQLADKLQPGNATGYDYDLSSFRARGGKLLMYHGYSDALISPGSSEYFYNQVYRTMYPLGIPVTDFFRLFLVPGMLHCQGTPASQNAPWFFAGSTQANSFVDDVHGVLSLQDARHDALLALVAWTEQGTAPDEIIATKFRDDKVSLGVDKQRPLCVYPQHAKYLGGDLDVASSWACDELGSQTE